MDEIIAGRVTHYFPKIQVAAISVETDELRIGDTIRILGATSDFTQTVNSMEIDHAAVDHARIGQEVAVELIERARVGDLVFRVVPYAHVDGISIGEEGAGP